MNGVLIIEPGTKIFALQQLLQCDAAIKADDIFKTHGPEPITVADNLGALRIENFECLFAVGLRVVPDLIMGEVRPGGGTPAWIANHPGKITDDQNGLVTEILELPKFLQHN